MFNDPLILYKEKNKELVSLFEQIKIDIIQELLYTKYENMSIINDEKLIIFPEYFNLKTQTHRIINFLENTNTLKELETILNKIINEKYLKYNTYKILINPQIIEKLKEIQRQLKEENFYE